MKEDDLFMPSEGDPLDGPPAPPKDRKPRDNNSASSRPAASAGYATSTSRRWPSCAQRLRNRR